MFLNLLRNIAYHLPYAGHRASRDFFFGKIQRGLRQSTSADEPVAPVLIQSTQHAIILPKRLPPLCFRPRIDEIGERLSLSQIKLAIFNSAPRELAAFRRPQTWDMRKR